MPTRRSWPNAPSRSTPSTTVVWWPCSRSSGPGIERRTSSWSRTMATPWRAVVFTSSTRPTGSTVISTLPPSASLPARQVSSASRRGPSEAGSARRRAPSTSTSRPPARAVAPVTSSMAFVQSPTIPAEAIGRAAVALAVGIGLILAWFGLIKPTIEDAVADEVQTQAVTTGTTPGRFRTDHDRLPPSSPPPTSVRPASRRSSAWTSLRRSPRPPISPPR